MLSLFLYFGGWSWRKVWQEGKFATIVATFFILTLDIGSLVLYLFYIGQIN